MAAILDGGSHIGKGSIMSNTPENVEPAAPAELEGIGIRVQGQLVAWFADPEMAEEWARENFFGQWLAHPCSMPNRPPFTRAQIEAAEREAEELSKKLGIPRSMAED